MNPTTVHLVNSIHQRTVTKAPDWVSLQSSSSSGDTTPNSSRDDEVMLNSQVAVGGQPVDQPKQLTPQAPSFRSDSLPCMSSMWMQHVQQQQAQQMLINSNDTHSELLHRLAEGRLREVALQEQLTQEAALRKDLAAQCALQLQQLQQEVALLRTTLQVIQSNAMVGGQDQLTSVVTHALQAMQAAIPPTQAGIPAASPLLSGHPQLLGQQVVPGTHAGISSRPPRDVSSPAPTMMCYHCHERTHNWSKCAQLSMLPDAVRLQCIEHYKRITDAEKRVDKDRRRAARMGATASAAAAALAGVPCM